MGSFESSKKSEQRGRPPGKINASLNKKLQNIEWGEYRLIDVFTVRNTKNILSRDIVENSGNTPYLCASAENNAISTYISYDESYKDKGNCLFIGGKTFVVTYQKQDFYSNDSHNLILDLKNEKSKTKSSQLFMATCIIKSLGGKYTWGNSISYSKIQKDKVYFPTKKGEIDFAFMEKFIAELEDQRIAELEAYLSVTGLKDTLLSCEEEQALREYSNLEWHTFNLEALFGKSTRGKRLKSADRVKGNLPFVTAGEANEGISDYIGNDVEIFSKNTTTIDMFGSAKYRNYNYGGDDHIAVVHTEKLPKFAAIFITTAIHKSSYTGKFNYSRNFYAKDADELNILLPTTNNKPNFEIMETLISAIQKIVIKNVVLYTDRKIQATKTAVSASNSIDSCNFKRKSLVK
ncbi:restriction endonuclease subunit S [Phascolarctobacterium faecium]|uniref:restriction endonuclease subunit S n=1 Tax=Phascolarctobacterium faecium TaxID=33025 RepID=UPI00266036C1|nr:restriction endonuclease subunit S [Phascolarctobacterium faecium]